MQDMDIEQIMSGVELRDNKRFTKLWIKRLVIGYVICMTLYFIWLFAFQGATISFNGNIQRNYAKFLIDKNDEFVTYMMEFEALTQSDPCLWQAILLCIIGFSLIFSIELVAKKISQKA